MKVGKETSGNMVGSSAKLSGVRRKKDWWIGFVGKIFTGNHGFFQTFHVEASCKIFLKTNPLMGGFYPKKCHSNIHKYP